MTCQSLFSGKNKKNASKCLLKVLPSMRSVKQRTLSLVPGYVPVSILYKSIAGRYRPARVADGPITARYRFIKNASWGERDA